MVKLTVILLLSVLSGCVIRVESLDDERYDAIIVGAGVAGIAAAKTLHDAGVRNYVVLEARNRTGGRIYSVDFDGDVIDLGAEFIVGNRDNPLDDIGRMHGVLDEMPHSSSPIYLTHSDGTQIDPHKAAAVMNKEEYMRASRDMKAFEGSYWDFMWPHLKDELKYLGEERRLESWEDLLRKILTANQGDSPDDLGARGVAQRLVQGHTMTTWINGYTTLLDILMGKMNDGDNASEIEEKIRLNKEAVKVEYSENGVKVYCSDGSTYTGNKSVVTLPLGVLKTLPTTFWSPHLPEDKTRAIQGFEVSTTNKIFLKFKEAIWPSYLKEFAVAFDTSGKNKLKNDSAPWLLDIAEFLVAKHNSNLLQIIVIGQGAKDIENASDDDIKNESMKILKLIFPKDTIAQPPLQLIRTSWHSDPFSKGSHVYRSVKTDKDGITSKDFSNPISFNGKPVIAFAGEAVHPHYFGLVHGAYLTGIEAANVIK